MVMDFVAGGELFTLLRKAKVRLLVRLPWETLIKLNSDFRTPWPYSMRRKLR
jgi:hypothetical protein